MSPAEYGAASMLSATSLLLTAVIAAPLIQLVIRAAARGEEDGPALLRVAGRYCYFQLPIAVALAATVFALLVPEFLGISGFIWGIELLAIGFQPATSVFALWVSQAREDLRRFVLLSSTSVLVTATSKLVLVVEMQLGVLGWAISDLLSACFVGGPGDVPCALAAGTGRCSPCSVRIELQPAADPTQCVNLGAQFVE